MYQARASLIQLGKTSVATSLLLLGSGACTAQGDAERFQSAERPAFPEAPPATPALPSAAPASPSSPAPSTSAPGEAPPTMLAAPSTSPATPAPGATTGEFELAWQDDFDTFDSSRWRLMTHSWDTNLAQFSTENVRLQDGLLSLLLTRQASDPAKPFRGVEMRSIETLTYGKVEARVRLARGPGVVSSLVLLYTPWPADDWNELDIEYLGRYSDRVQFNTMVYTGAPTQPPVQVSVTPTQEPHLAPLSFDPSGDFHVYSIAWTPSEVRFEVDGQPQYLWSAQIARMKLPQNILLTIWASSAADWAGPIALDLPPTSADYDWLRVYRYKPTE